MARQIPGANQLVLNSGFEMQPAGEWLTFFNSGGAKDDLDSHQGNFNARLVTDADAAFPAVIFQIIEGLELGEGDLVRFAFYAQKPGGDLENPESNIIAAVSFDDAEGVTVATLPITITEGRNPRCANHVAYEAFLQLPAGTEEVDFATVAIANSAPPAGTSTLLVDDIVLVAFQR